MAYGKYRAKGRRYTKKRRTYKRKSYRRGKRPVRRSTKRYSRKGTMSLSVPGKFYKINISRSQGSQLKSIFKKVIRHHLAGAKISKSDYKKRERMFILAGAMKGLTDKIYNMRNHESYHQAHVAMNALGMGEGIVDGVMNSDEPHPNPTSGLQGAGSKFMGAAADVGASLLREHGPAVVNAGLNYALGTDGTLGPELMKLYGDSS